MMARTFRFRRWNFPAGLERSLSQELIGDQEHGFLVARYRSRASLHEQPVPRPVVEACLGERGWPPKRAHRWFFERDHAMWHEEPERRRAHYRAYRRRTNMALTAQNYDEIAPYVRTSGWLTW